MKKSTIVSLLSFLVISGILIFCWFRFGYIYGGGDTGLPTYNPKVMVGIASNIWWESLAPGIPVAQGLTSVPMLFMLSIPQALGASPVIIQALLFFTLLFLMGYGMYLLALNIFGKSNYFLATAAGMFYLFNPYMMIQIWHRFIHNAFVFAAFLPFLIMTWLWWIRKRNPFYLLLFLFTNFLAVYIYGTIAFIVAVWTLLFFLTLLEALVPWKGKKEVLGLCLAFFIGCIFWLLTNSWWFIPVFNVSPALFASVHSTDGSLSTLMALSSSSILPYTLRLINPFYLYWQADFGSSYQNIVFQIISWLFVLVVAIGFVRGLRQKAYTAWSLLLLIIIFLSKGIAPPFSFPYIFGFSHFFPLGVIRNPFEKLGILLPFIYAILFCLGLQFLLTTGVKYIGKSKTYLLLIIFIILHMAFFWPMFAGKLFGTLDKQNFVEVPKSYTQANEWIKQDIKNTATGKEGRILHLPLPRSEDATYNWEYGYHGVEPSAAIFTSLPSIARSLVPQYSDALAGLSLIFYKPNAYNPSAILKMLQDFNVKYILLHKDIQWLGGELYSPHDTENILDKLEFLEKPVMFGDLIVYKLKDVFFSPKIIVSDNVELLYPSPVRNNLFWPWMIASPSAQMVTTVYSGQDRGIIDKVNKIIIMPEESRVFRNLEIPKFQGNLDNFNNIRILPNSPLYFLIDFKEQLSLLVKSKAERQQMRVIFADKRLVEIYRIKRMRELGIIDQETGNRLITLLLKKYQDLLINIFKDELMTTDIVIGGSQQFNITDVFLKHISLLEEFVKTPFNVNGEKEFASKIISQINYYMIKSGLSPKYPIIDENGLSGDFRQEYTFNISVKSTYELFTNGINVKSIYPSNLSELNFQINDSNQKFLEEDKGSLMAFGKREMEVGEYQISTPRLLSSNLIPVLPEWSKSGNVNITDSSGVVEISSGDKDISYIEAEVKPVYGRDSYLVSFGLKIQSGKGVRVQMNEDTNPIDIKSNKAILGYNDYYVPTNFDKNGWSRYEAIINLRLTTQRAKLKIEAQPWDDCLTVLADKDRCSDQKVRELYNQSSKLIIKNISVSRILNNDLFLTTGISGNMVATPSGEVVDVNKRNSSQYFGRIKITRPTFLFFKESFDPGWELKLMKNNEMIQPKQHMVANLFANAWFIEQPGDYDFTLNFNPEKLVILGLFLAGMGWVMVLIVYVGYNLQRSTFKK